LFIAPFIIGNGKHAFANVATEKLADMKRFKIAGSLQSDVDEHIVLIK
jgi:NADH:ubiquinone oxidoreductase subunit F (NADH-binding)